MITEAAYMLRKRPDHRDDLLQAVLDGDLVILRLRERDLEPVRDIFAKYHDQDVQPGRCLSPTLGGPRTD